MDNIKHLLFIFNNIDTIYEYLSINDISQLREVGCKELNYYLEKFPKKHNIDKVFKTAGNPCKEPSDHHKLHYGIQKYETKIGKTVNEYIDVYRRDIEKLSIIEVLPALRVMIYIWMLDLSIIAVKFTIENIENCLQQVYELEKDNRPKDVTEQTYFGFLNLIISFRLFAAYFISCQDFLSREMSSTIFELTNKVKVQEKLVEKTIKRINKGLSSRQELKVHEESLKQAKEERSKIYTERMEPFRQSNFVSCTTFYIKCKKDKFLANIK